MPSHLTGCWVDLYTGRGFAQPIRRLFGPVKYVALRAKGNGWGIQFAGIAVGPGTYAMLYSGTTPDMRFKWLMPGEKIENIEEMDSGWPLDSIQVFDHPPGPGTEGYEAFIRRDGYEQPTQIQM